ncbi:MAG: hypothetical protein GXP19_07050 [Gammaproteobacteria bacterium]|nr:hypothetical protein [Gammaproteobacteria bacterium]
MTVTASLLWGFIFADGKVFKRIATFPVFQNTSIANETVAEIASASTDGNTLVYTDGKSDNLGFVDITDPANPLPGGVIAVGGEPTSVVVTYNLALVAVNTSPSFIAPSGKLQDTKTLVTTIGLGGQPVSGAISPDGHYAAVVIENERDEDLGNGEPSQAPAGFLVINDFVGSPQSWVKHPVNLDGVADLFAGATG